MAQTRNGASLVLKRREGFVRTLHMENLHCRLCLKMHVFPKIDIRKISTPK